MAEVAYPNEGDPMLVRVRTPGGKGGGVVDDSHRFLGYGTTGKPVTACGAGVVSTRGYVIEAKPKNRMCAKCAAKEA